MHIVLRQHSYSCRLPTIRPALSERCYAGVQATTEPKVGTLFPPRMAHHKGLGDGGSDVHGAAAVGGGDRARHQPERRLLALQDRLAAARDAQVRQVCNATLQHRDLFDVFSIMAQVARLVHICATLSLRLSFNWYLHPQGGRHACVSAGVLAKQSCLCSA